MKKGKYEDCKDLPNKFITNSNNFSIKLLYLLIYLFNLLFQAYFFALT